MCRPSYADLQQSKIVSSSLSLSFFSILSQQLSLPAAAPPPPTYLVFSPIRSISHHSPSLPPSPLSTTPQTPTPLFDPRRRASPSTDPRQPRLRQISCGVGDGEDLNFCYFAAPPSHLVSLDLFNKGKNGKISVYELHAMLHCLGEKSSLKDCWKMISNVDVDGDGCVNFEEFKKMMAWS